MPTEDTSVAAQRPVLKPILRGVLVGLGPVIFLGFFLGSGGDAVGLLPLGAGGLAVALLQRLFLLLLAAIIISVAALFGMSLLRKGARPLFPGELVVGGGIGLGALSLVGLGLGLAGWLNVTSAMLVLGLMLIVGIPSIVRIGRRLRDRDRTRTPFSTVELLLLLAIVFVVMLLAIVAMRPPMDYDAREYHMACPARWFRLGRIDHVPGNVYSNFPMNAEMLYLFGMSLVGRPMLGIHLGMVLNAMTSVLAGGAVFVTARRLASRQCALAATTLFLTMPHMLVSGAVNLHNEPLLTFYATLAVFAFLEFLDTSRLRSVILCGLFAGLASGVKYTALAFFPIVMAAAVVAAARRTRPMKRVALGALCLLTALIVVSPWLIKNQVMTSNPVYPFFYERLGGRDWSEELADKWVVGQMKAAGAHEASNPFVALWERVIFHRFGSLAIVVFALIGAFALRERSVRWLLIFLVLWTVFWYAFTHRVPRFYLPMAGAAAVLAARGIAFLGTGWKRIALVVMLLVALGWQVRVDVLQLSSAAPAYDIVRDADRFFRATRDPFFPVIVFAREHPPPDRLMLVGEAQTLHLPPTVMASTVFNREVFTTTVGDVSDPETVRARLAEAGVTHLFVNWAEIGRLRKTYTWTDRKGRTHPGFPPLTPADFNRLERAGVLTELPEWCYGLPRKRGLVPGLILEELKQLPGGRLCVFYRVN